MRAINLSWECINLVSVHPAVHIGSGHSAPPQEHFRATTSNNLYQPLNILSSFSTDSTDTDIVYDFGEIVKMCKDIHYVC